MSNLNRPTASRPADNFNDNNAYYPRLDSPNPHGFIPWNNQAQQQNSYIIPPHESQLPSYMQNQEPTYNNYMQSQDDQFPTFPNNPSPINDTQDYADEDIYVEETPSLQQEGPSQGAKKKKVQQKAKVRKWVPAEELALTQAYIDTSEDSVDGNAQKADRFWNTVETKFYEVQGVEPYRSKHAITTKWKEMNQKMTKWAGILTNLNAMRASGESDEMIQARALEEYRLVSNGVSFSLHACYDIVKQSPRWRAPPQPSNLPHQPASKRSKTSHDGSASSDGRCGFDLNDANASDDEPPRPPGRDKARKARLAGGSSSGTAVSEELVDKLSNNMSLFATSYQNQIDFEREKYEEKKKQRERLMAHKEREHERMMALKEREHELRVLSMAGDSEDARIAVEMMAREIARKYRGGGSGGN